MRAPDRLLKTGAVGTVVTAACCFTPVLAWPLAALGLGAAVAYLDYLLFPLLGIFVIMLAVGVARHAGDRHP